MDCELTLTRDRQFGPVQYQLAFCEISKRFVIAHEQISKSDEIYFKRDNGTAKLMQTPHLEISPSPNGSVLSQFKNPADTTPITEMGNDFSRIRIFREFRTGPQSSARHGISMSVQNDALMDGGDNLALVLHELDFHGVHARIRGYLERFCERFEDVKVRLGEGLARTFLTEAGLTDKVSGARMSDGTLKFLSLLAALFHPTPPPLLCIEEPETGLHPDALQLVAEALIEASESTQLIITTHSEALVDALTDRPERVLVCERDFDNGTQMKRLSKEKLKDWLRRYTLGQLWRKGEIGGGRW
jgi:predicted ATPase